MIHARDRPRSCHAHERRRELHNSSVGMPVDASCQQHEHRRAGSDMAQLDHHRWSARCIQDSRNSRRRSSADRLSLWRGRHNTRSLCEQRKAFRSRDFGVNAGSPLHRMGRARRKRCIASNAVASNGAWRAKRPAPVAPASADRTRALSTPWTATGDAHQTDGLLRSKPPLVSFLGPRRERSITGERAEVPLRDLPSHQRDVVLFALATGWRQSSVLRFA